MRPAREHVLFVFALAGDETAIAGGTIATLIESGAGVTVLTATRDERAGSHLAEALAALGVTDHRELGSVGARWPDKEPRTYTESGWRGANRPPGSLSPIEDRSLSAAPFGEVSGDIAAVIYEVQPTAVVSHDENGGDKHPDRIRTHEATLRAAEVMEVPFFVAAPHGGGKWRVDVAPVAARKQAALAALAAGPAREVATYTASIPVLPSADVTVESFRRIAPTLSAPVTFSEQSLITKISLVVIFVILGAAVGLLMTAVHQVIGPIAGVVVPWGIIVALGSTAALLIGSRLALGSRIPPAIAGVSLLAMSLFITSPTRGGSVLIGDGLPSILWIWLVPLLVLAVVAWPKSKRALAAKIGALPAAKGSSIS